jgi:hypothetical protein
LRRNVRFNRPGTIGIAICSRHMNQQTFKPVHRR